MKLLRIGLPVLLVLFSLFLLKRHFAADPDAPRFVPVASVPAIKQFRYEFNHSSQGGNLWLDTWEAGSTNYHSYLFNLDQRKIMGELANANNFEARGFNSNASKLFCEQVPVPAGPVKRNIAAIISRVTGGKISFPNTNPAVTLWMLDLQNGGAKKIARVQQPFFVIGAWWQFSPGYRHASGYAFSYREKPALIFHAIDLDSGDVRRFQLNGLPLVWWDDRQMIIRNNNSDLTLLDVETAETNLLFSARAIEDFMSENNLRGNPLSVMVFSRRNGKQRDLYFYGGNGFVAKVDTTGPRLNLVMRHCDFISQLINPNEADSTMTHGVNMYPSTNVSGLPLDGIYLHDFTNGHAVELLAPTPEETGSLAKGYPNRDWPFPSIYRDKIIYRQQVGLWQMDMNGSNRVKLFPPPEK